MVGTAAGNQVGPEVGHPHLQDYISVGIFVDPVVAGIVGGCRTDLK